ncbi:hypothetical protein D3C87_1709740 [compost metagenome]
MAAEIEMQVVLVLGIGLGPEHRRKTTAGRIMRQPQQPPLRRGCRQPVALDADAAPVLEREAGHIHRIGKAVLGGESISAIIAVAAHIAGAGGHLRQRAPQHGLGIAIHIGDPVGQRAGHLAIGGDGR